MNNNVAQTAVMIFDELFTSSSEDDGSDEELIANLNEQFHRSHHQIRRIPRVLNFVENIVYFYTEKEFQESFRLQKSTFNYILFLISPALESRVGRIPVSPEKQLLITLYVLGTPDSYRSVTTKFGISKSTAWHSVKRVVKAMCQFRNYFIQWPSNEKAIETSERIRFKSTFPGVIGFLDGTHIRIAKPKDDPVSYVNRKGVHTMQLQVVCNDKLEFIHCSTGLPGCVHDMRVFRYSGLQRKCNDNYFPNNTHILADSAYTLQKHVIVPYRDNGHLTVEQLFFNTVLSGIRTTVERSIGLLKNRWRYLLHKLPMRRTDLIPYYILCACILHNVCLKRGDTFEFPIVIPNNIEEELEPLNVNDVNKEEGNNKRNYLTELINR